MRPEQRLRRRAGRRHGGFALILVIWSLVALLGLAAGFSLAVRHEARVAADAIDRLDAEAAAVAVRNYAIYAMNLREQDLRWLPDGQVHRVRWGDVLASVRLRAESGRIDINRAPAELLRGLLEVCVPDGPHAALADALVDWRDPDDTAQEAGAEAPEYTAAGLGYGPSNRPFRSIHEVNQVLGFTPDVVEAIRPYITVHSRRPRINATSAEARALAAVPGVDLALAERFVAARDAARAAGEPAPLEMLDEGRRLVEMHLDNRVVLLDITLRAQTGPTYAEQVVLALDRSRNYRMLARDPLPAPADGDPEA